MRKILNRGNISKMLSFSCLFILFFCFFVVQAQAGMLDSLETAKGPLQDGTPQLIVASIIKMILGFLGLGFTVYMLYGGYLWGMSRGNEQEVTKAKSTIRNAVIGLAIILSSYAIAEFIIRSMAKIAG